MRRGHIAPSLEFHTDGSYMIYKATLKIAILWDVTPFSPVYVYRYFRGTRIYADDSGSRFHRNISTNLKDNKSQNIFIIIISSSSSISSSSISISIKFKGRITRGSCRVMEVLQIREKLYFLLLLINYQIGHK